MPESHRTPERRGPERRSGVRHNQSRFKVAVLIAVAAIVVLALEILANRDGSADDNMLATPPAELLGKWLTDDPLYATAPFVIASDHIEFHLGESSGIRSYPILSLRAVQGSESWEYEINYRTPGGDLTMGVHLHPDGVLRLRNPAEVVWRREPAG